MRSLPKAKREFAEHLALSELALFVRTRA